MEESIRKKALSSAIWKYAERLIAQAVTLIVSIILARLLDPDDFSVVSIVTIFFAFASVLISGGLNTALVQKKDADRLDYSTVFFESLTVSLLAYLLLFLLAPAISQAYQKPVLVPVVRVMSLALPINAVKSIVCAFISSRLQFRKFFLATIVGTVISAAVGILMALKGFGVWALVAQYMVNAVIDTILLIVSTGVIVSFRFSVVRLKELFGYGSKILLSSLINELYNELCPLVIGLKFSTLDLSFYSKGKSFPSFLSSTTTDTLSAVLFPVLSKYQDDKQRLLGLTRRFIQLTSFCVFPMMLGLFVVSDSFVRVVLTEKWLPITPYIRIFCVSTMFTMLATGNCETIKAMGRSDVYLIIEVIKKVLYFICVGLAVIFRTTPIAVAFSSIACTGIALIVNAIPNRKLIGYRFTSQIMDILPNLLSSILMAVLVSFIGLLRIHTLLLLVIQIASGILLYIMIGLLTKNRSLAYFRNLIRERKWG